MILYATKQTIKELHIPMIDELSGFNKLVSSEVLEHQKDNKLFEWGIKLFYFDNRKCVQAVNFASKVTIFIFDLQKEQIKYIGDAIARYLFDIYDKDKKMQKILKQFFEDYPICTFAKLEDRSIIATLNHNQLHFADDGNRFYDYIENGILKTRQINKDFNWRQLISIKNDKKANYIFPAEHFRELLFQKYYIK